MTNQIDIKAKTSGDFVLTGLSMSARPSEMVTDTTGLAPLTIRPLTAEEITSISAGAIPANLIVSNRPENGRMTIGEAVEALREGKRVSREGWNGKRMHLELQVPDAHSKMTLPYVFMFTADGHRVPWLCSQTDLLASDWGVVS